MRHLETKVAVLRYDISRLQWRRLAKDFGWYEPVPGTCPLDVRVVERGSSFARYRRWPRIRKHPVDVLVSTNIGARVEDLLDDFRTQIIDWHVREGDIEMGYPQHAI
jgi:hypothetical protein